MQAININRKIWSGLKTLTLVLALIIGVLFLEPALNLLPPYHFLQDNEKTLRNVLLVALVFVFAHILHKLALNQLTQRRRGQRPIPRVLLDIFKLFIYSLATLIALPLLLGQDISGFLTGSGILLALLGFAIRNVVADTLSGIAIGIEAPFRMGDWVRIETLAQGRIQEIGWRTTRLITKDETYVILPNSQISRQRITNYSAPKKEYRDQAEFTFPVTTPIVEARRMMEMALAEQTSFVDGTSADIHVISYTPLGITYLVKYWVPKHKDEAKCRTEVFELVDRKLRDHGVLLTQPCITNPTHSDYRDSAEPQ